jgi:hypothetical protein
MTSPALLSLSKGSGAHFALQISSRARNSMLPRYMGAFRVVAKPISHLLHSSIELSIRQSCRRVTPHNLLCPIVEPVLIPVLATARLPALAADIAELGTACTSYQLELALQPRAKTSLYLRHVVASMVQLY